MRYTIVESTYNSFSFRIEEGKWIGETVKVGNVSHKNDTLHYDFTANSEMSDAVVKDFVVAIISDLIYTDDVIVSGSAE